MADHEFTLVIDRVLDGEELDLLYEAGFDDSTPEIEAGRTLLHITRSGPIRVSVVLDAEEQLQRTGFPVVSVREAEVEQLARECAEKYSGALRSLAEYDASGLDQGAVPGEPA